MKVWITLQKTNTGRVLLSCLRSTSQSGPVGTGWALTPFNPNARAEIEDLLRNLGVAKEAIADKLSALYGGAQFVQVAEVEVSESELREAGFV